MSNPRWPLYVLVAWCLWAVGCGPKNGPVGLPLAQPFTEIERVVIQPDTGSSGFTSTVSGRITFEKLSLLDEQGNVINRRSTIQPLRAVDVEARDASGARISTTVATDDNGSFTISVLPRTPFTILVVSTTTGTSGRVNLEVRSAITPFPLYGISIGQDAAATPFAGLAPFANATLAIDPFPSLVAPAGGGFRPGAVANILDAAFVASEAHRLATGQTLPLATFFWSPDSTAGSFFQAPSFITIKGGNSDTDETDEFDDSVIQHEFGHFMFQQISRDFSIGGAHGGDVLYPTLAYNEGIANWWTCAVRKVQTYLDSFAITSATPQFFTLELESTGTQGNVRGRESEETVGQLIWDLSDGTEGRVSTDGDAPALTLGQLLTAAKNLQNTVVATVIDDFLQANIDAGFTSRTAVEQLLLFPEDQQFTFNGADAFPTPITRGGPFLNDNVATIMAKPFGTNSGIDLANRFFKFDLPATTANVSISIQMAGVTGTDATGTNVNLFLLDPKVAVVASSKGQTSFEQIIVPSLAPGRYYIYVTGRPDPFSGDQKTNASEQLFQYTVGLQ